MGCVFESAREQPKQSTTKQTQNQCSRITSTLVRNIEIKDNYKQSHKTQTAAATATAKHLKAAAQVLLAEQRQQQQQQQQQFFQVAHDNKVALATRETILTINIQASRQPSTLQINCSNCYSRSTKITKNEQRRYRRIHWCQHHAARGCGSCTGRSTDIGAKATLAGISSQAQTDLANLLDEKGKDRQEQHEKDGRRDVEQPLAYLTWRLGNVASAVVPITMSAAILSTLSTTLAAGYQYLAQHYKQYSQSFSFYAASSVVLMLCYLTTTSMAAATQSETVAIDKHPIIDWSKFDESSSDKEILDLLLEKKRYDKRLLPPVNDEDFCCGLQSPDMATNQNARRPHNRGTLTVNVNVLLLSLASPDESSLKYEVEFLLNQQWNDPRLQYGNKSHYDFLNALHHHDSIWTPDTYFIMHGDFKDPIIPMHFALRIFRNGTITYAMRRHLILSCQGSLHIFPFDDPKCSFSMESISYEEAQIKYVWKNDEDTLRKSPSLTTLNAYLIKNQTTACDQNSWRGVTTMLNFFTTSNGFRSTLPVVSNLTAMNVWDGVCMCFIYASLLEFVCVNYVGRKRPLHNVVYRPGENPVTQRLPAVLSRIGVILASPLPGEKRRDAGAPNEIVACTTCGSSNSPCTHSANNGCATETCFVQMRKKEPPHPIRVAKTIDVIARITFPTAYAIFLIFFFVHYKGFS
nr:glycine receptor subunit alpha-1 isoform X30 [Drosophila virilis]